MLKKQTKRKLTEGKLRRRKEQTSSRLSENMSGHPYRPPLVPFPSARPLQSSQDEISESSVKNSNSNELQVDQNHFFDIQSFASSRYEPLIPDFSLSSSGTGRRYPNLDGSSLNYMVHFHVSGRPFLCLETVYSNTLRPFIFTLRFLRSVHF